jgi:hypothetical protein
LHPLSFLFQQFTGERIREAGRALLCLDPKPAIASSARAKGSTMKKRILAGALLLLVSLPSFAEDGITVSGTPIPKQLLEQNYGKMPKGVGAFDLSICNVSNERQTVVSSHVYQSLAQSNVALSPIGRQIMLASILRNDSRSITSILGVTLNSATGIAAVLGASGSVGVPNGLFAGIGLSAILLGQVTNALKPVLTQDKLEKFDREVLEPALVLDGGSCVERTVFALNANGANKPKALQFRMK